MADRARFWSPVPDWDNAVFEGGNIRIRPMRGAVQSWLVSGHVEAFPGLGALAVLGPRDTCDGRRYALRLAPDRILLVDGSVASGEEPRLGWSDGFAVTEVSAGFVLLDVTGAAADDVMEHGASYDWKSTDMRPEESAAMIFAQMKVAIGRLESGWRLHVERPLAPALWRWLENLSIRQVET